MTLELAQFVARVLAAFVDIYELSPNNAMAVLYRLASS